jgi:hypothetical protein
MRMTDGLPALDWERRPPKSVSAEMRSGDEDLSAGSGLLEDRFVG